MFIYLYVITYTKGGNVWSHKKYNSPGWLKLNKWIQSYIMLTKLALCHGCLNYSYNHKISYKLKKKKG